MTTKQEVERLEFEYDAPTRTLTWRFGAGIDDVVYQIPVVVSDDATVPDALLLGYKTKIANGAAIAKDTKTGKSATPAEKAEAMREVRNRLADEQEWNARAGAKPKVIDLDALVAAMAAERKKPVMAVRAFLESRTEEQRKAFANSKEFAAAYALAVASKRAVSELSAETQAELDAIPDEV